MLFPSCWNDLLAPLFNLPSTCSVNVYLVRSYPTTLAGSFLPCFYFHATSIHLIPLLAPKSQDCLSTMISPRLTKSVFVTFIKIHSISNIIKTKWNITFEMAQWSWSSIYISGFSFCCLLVSSVIIPFDVKKVPSRSPVASPPPTPKLKHTMAYLTNCLPPIATI